MANAHCAMDARSIWYRRNDSSVDYCWVCVDGNQLYFRNSIRFTAVTRSVRVGNFRCYSKNYPARARELEKYQEVMQKPKAWWRLTNKRWENRNTTLYFRCKGCNTVLNVPKGKGKLLVTCPKCGTKVEKNPK